MAAGKPVELHHFARAELQHSVFFYRERGGDELAKRLRRRLRQASKTLARSLEGVVCLRPFPLRGYAIVRVG